MELLLLTHVESTHQTVHLERTGKKAETWGKWLLERQQQGLQYLSTHRIYKELNKT